MMDAFTVLVSHKHFPIASKNLRKIQEMQATFVYSDRIISNICN